MILDPERIVAGCLALARAHYRRGFTPFDRFAQEDYDAYANALAVLAEQQDPPETTLPPESIPT